MAQDPLILALETSGRIGSVAVALGDKILAESTFSAPLRHSAEIFPAISALLQRFGRKPSQVRHVYISVGPGSFTGLRIAVTIAKTMHLTNHAKLVAVDSLDVIAANAINLTAEHAQSVEKNSTSPKRKRRDKSTPSRSGLVASSANSAVKKPKIEKIAAILDAKRSQFFTAVYEHRPHDTTLSSPHSRDSTSAIRLPRGGDTQYAIRLPRGGDTQYEKIFPDSLLTASQFLEKFADPNQPVCLLGDGLLYHKEKFKADGVRFLDQQYWSPRAANVHLLGRKLALTGKFADALTLQPNYLRRPEAEEKWQKR